MLPLPNWVNDNGVRYLDQERLIGAREILERKQHNEELRNVKSIRMQKLVS